MKLLTDLFWTLFLMLGILAAAYLMLDTAADTRDLNSIHKSKQGHQTQLAEAAGVDVWWVD